MSLINRMLQDLAMRQPAPANVSSGLQFAIVPPAADDGASRRELALLLVLVLVFTSALWWLFAAQQAPANRADPLPPAWTLFRLDGRLDLQRLAQPAPVLPSAGAPRAQLRLSAALHEPPPRRAAPRAVAARDVATAPAAAPGPQAVRVGGTEPAASADIAAVEAPPGDVMTMARAALARGEPQAALDLLRPAAPELAANPEYQGLLAAAYQRLGRHETAAEAYRALIGLQPEQAHWWAAYGISLDALAQGDAALRAFDRARALGALDAQVLDYIVRRSAQLRQPG